MAKGTDIRAARKETEYKQKNAKTFVKTHELSLLSYKVY